MSKITTTAENAYNLRTARKAVARQLGIEDSSSIEYADRIEYNRTLAGFILQYPNGFTDAQLKSAAIVAGTSYPDLADPKFDWGQFGDLFAENAAEVTTAGSSWLKTLSVVAVLAVAAFYILPGAISRADKAA